MKKGTKILHSIVLKFNIILYLDCSANFYKFLESVNGLIYEWFKIEGVSVFFFLVKFDQV